MHVRFNITFNSSHAFVANGYDDVATAAVAVVVSSLLLSNGHVFLVYNTNTRAHTQNVIKTLNEPISVKQLKSIAYFLH